MRVATLPESHGAHRSQGSDCQPGVVADFGRSCLPGSTSRLAATSVHVNRQYRLAVSLERRTRFAGGESPFRQKGPTLKTIRDYTTCRMRFGNGPLRTKPARARESDALNIASCLRIHVFCDIPCGFHHLNFSVCRDILSLRFENESWLSRMRSGQISLFMGRNDFSRFPSRN